MNKEDASDEDEDTEYFDAMDDSTAFITVTASENTQYKSVSMQFLSLEKEMNCIKMTKAKKKNHIHRSQQKISFFKF